MDEYRNLGTVRRFALMPGSVEVSLIDVSTVSVAVVMYHGTVAKLVEIVEGGIGQGRAQAIFWEVRPGKGRSNPVDWYEAVRSVRQAPFVARLVRYRLEARGRVMTVTEFHPPLEAHRYAEIEASPDDPMVGLPSWVGREVTRDPLQSVYGAVVEAYRLRRKTGTEVLP